MLTGHQDPEEERHTRHIRTASGTSEQSAMKVKEVDGNAENAMVVLDYFQCAAQKEFLPAWAPEQKMILNQRTRFSNYSNPNLSSGGGEREYYYEVGVMKLAPCGETCQCGVRVTITRALPPQQELATPSLT